MPTEKVLSGKFKLNRYNYKKIIKVAVWTVLAGALTSLIAFIPEVDFPVMYAFVPAILNTLLFSALEFVKEQRG